MFRVVRTFSIAALTFLLTCAVAAAQLSTAELAGTVRDSSGGVLPGVTVTVTPGSTAPLESRTVPASSAVDNCAVARVHVSRKVSAAIENVLTTRSIEASCITVNDF